MNIISVKNLEKRFGDNLILRDVCASVEKGEVISIIGPSGTGKSTFLRAINFLDPPTGGEVLFDGEKITKKNMDAARRRMGMVAGYIYYPESSEISNNFALAGMAAGGIAGFNMGDIQSHGINKTDAALKTQSTYSGELGWKFGTSDAAPWRMASGVYPSLYWE